MSQTTFSEISPSEFRVLYGHGFANCQTKQGVLNKLRSFYNQIGEVRAYGGK